MNTKNKASQTEAAENQGAGNLKAVRKAELEQIAKRRRVAFGNPRRSDADPTSKASRKKTENLAGLAFSGGGLRSAAFCMGITQAFHKTGLWKFFDYLSTVSGGGYIGAHISSAAIKNKKRISKNGADFPLPAEETGGKEVGQSDELKKFIYGGRYLMRGWQLANKHLISLLLTNLTMFSGLVAVCALIAFLWRCFDLPAFRERVRPIAYAADMDYLKSDMVAAFYPFLFFTFAWLGAWAFSYFRRGSVAPGRIARMLLFWMVASFLIGAALALSNGTVEFTSVKFNPSEWGPKVWGPIVAVVGGSLIPFLRPSRLMQSGLNPKNQFEAVTFRIATTGLLIGVPLIIIGFIGRENISGYHNSDRREIVPNDGSWKAVYKKVLEQEDFTGPAFAGTQTKAQVAPALSISNQKEVLEQEEVTLPALTGAPIEAKAAPALSIRNYKEELKEIADPLVATLEIHSENSWYDYDDLAATLVQIIGSDNLKEGNALAQLEAIDADKIQKLFLTVPGVPMGSGENGPTNPRLKEKANAIAVARAMEKDAATAREEAAAAALALKQLEEATMALRREELAATAAEKEEAATFAMQTVDRTVLDLTAAEEAVSAAEKTEAEPSAEEKAPATATEKNPDAPGLAAEEAPEKTPGVEEVTAETLALKEEAAAMLLKEEAMAEARAAKAKAEAAATSARYEADKASLAAAAMDDEAFAEEKAMAVALVKKTEEAAASAEERAEKSALAAKSIAPLDPEDLQKRYLAWLAFHLKYQTGQIDDATTALKGTREWVRSVRQDRLKRIADAAEWLAGVRPSLLNPAAKFHHWSTQQALTSRIFCNTLNEFLDASNGDPVLTALKTDPFLKEDPNQDSTAIAAADAEPKMISIYGKADPGKPLRTIVIREDQAKRFSIFLTSLVIFMLGLLVDLNFTSMHGYYRRRIASLFIVPEGKKRESPMMSAITTADYGYPYHLLSGSINLPRRRLADEIRIATSNRLQDEQAEKPTITPFLFSQQFCGSEVTGYAATNYYEELPVGDLASLDLADAAAMSGAAINPGQVQNMLLSFLMFVLNLRLGQWLPNPSKKRPSTRPRLGLILKNRMLNQGHEADYVFISDGGHSENLGLVALMQRRCRLIVAVDAGQDPNHDFADLARAIRIARIEEGIQITPLAPKGADMTEDIVSNLRLKSERQKGAPMSQSPEHFSLARIQYPEADSPDGLLVYIKPSITGDESADLIQYSDSYPEFPHESTSDQDFDWSQVESYRQLGYHIGCSVSKELQPVGKYHGDLWEPTEAGIPDVEAICGWFEESWLKQFEPQDSGANRETITELVKEALARELAKSNPAAPSKPSKPDQPIEPKGRSITPETKTKAKSSKSKKSKEKTKARKSKA